MTEEYNPYLECILRYMPEGDPVIVFPGEAADMEGRMASWVRLGGHSAISEQVYQDTEPLALLTQASNVPELGLEPGSYAPSPDRDPQVYSDLRNFIDHYLEDGEKLKVVKRRQRRHFESRRAQVRGDES